MADEVTKKDLQSLQGYCNKQVADVNKRIDNACKAVNDVSRRIDEGAKDAENRSAGIEAAANKRMAALEARLAELEKT